MPGAPRGRRRPQTGPLGVLFRIAQGGGRVCDSVPWPRPVAIEPVARGLDGSEPGREVGLALGQAFEIGDGRLVVVTYIVESEFGVAQSLRDVVAVGHRLRQLAVEACLALREVASGCREGRFVSLFRIAQGRIGICGCLLERCAPLALLTELPVQPRFALGGPLAGGQSLTGGTHTRVIERGLCGSQTWFEMVAARCYVGESRAEIRLACREALDI